MSALAKTAARLTAVVVFPTPPFWFARAIIFAMRSSGFPSNFPLARKLTHNEAEHGWILRFIGKVRQRMFHVSPTGLKGTRETLRPPMSFHVYEKGCQSGRRKAGYSTGLAECFGAGALQSIHHFV